MSETAENGTVVVRHMYRLMLARTTHLKRWAGAARFAHSHALDEQQRGWNLTDRRSLPGQSAGAAIVCDGRPDRRRAIS